MYVGETGRRYRVKQKEHMKDVNQIEGVKFTRVRKKESQTKVHQSALIDHIGSWNHTVDWEKVRLLAEEPN